MLVRSLWALGGAEPIAGPRICANAILNISEPNLSFCLLEAGENSQKAAEFSSRIRRTDFDASGERVNDRRRLTSRKFERWLVESGKEAEKYKKAINKYKDGAENEKSTPNQAN